MKARQARSIIVTLLLLSAVSFTLANYAVPPTPQLLPKVQASALTVTLTDSVTSSNSGPPGSVVDVSASGAAAGAGTSCSIVGSGPAGFVTGSSAIVATGGNVYGTFRVGNVASGVASATYTVTVTCPAVGPLIDSGSKTFQVQPSVTLSTPASAFPAAITAYDLNVGDRKILVTGIGFASDATTCSITGTAGLIEISGGVPESTCTISGGTVSGSFVIDDSTAVPGANTVTVTPNTGLTGIDANFNVVTAPTIALRDATHAPIGFGSLDGGMFVVGGGFVNGTGAARSCTLTGTGGIVATPSCTINNDGTVVASFTVASTGARMLTVTDPLSLASATVAFTGDPSPTVITFSPAANGKAGDIIDVITGGVGFSPLDAGPCSLVSVPTGAPDATSQTCIIDTTGTLKTTAAPSPTRFTVAANAAGQPYSVEVQSVHGVVSISAAFAVKAAVTLTTTPPTSPTSGSPPLGATPGTTVSVTGTGYAFGDTGTSGTGCAITSAGLVGATTCTINPSTGQLTGTFVVASTATFQTYTVTVNGGGGGTDLATAGFNVVPIIAVSPTSGGSGTGVLVSGAGFKSGGGLTCTPPPGTGFVSVPSSLFAAAPAASCTIDATGKAVATFSVDAAAFNGLYTITLTGSDSALDTASTTFGKNTVVTTTTTTTSAPTITLNPFAGVVGTVVSISGNGFASGDVGTYNCLSSTPSPDIIIAPTCTFTSGGSMSGSFTVVASAALGAHSIRVTGKPTSDFASATFTVTTGPTLTLAPTGGQTGITVQATVSGFAPTDTQIAFTSSPSALFSTPLTCTPISGACSTTFTVTGTPGSYQVIATGTPVGDSASTVFNAGTGDAFLTMNPPEGPPGTLVTVSGNIPFAGDSSCSIGGGTGNGIGTNTWSCTIVATTSFTHTSFAGSFVVSNLSPGAYSVRVSGSGGNTVSSATITNAQNYVEGTFIVTGPKIILTPNSGRIGITVIIGGSGFSFADTTCSLSVSQGSGSINQNGACSIGGGTGTPSGSFTVGNVVPGTYVLRVTGSTSDFAEATFTVVSGPTITLLPTSGPPGTVVIVTGSGFLPQDSTCSISGTPVQNPACSITLGSGAPTGSFQVSAVASGAYTVTVSASSGGDSAQAVFTVTVQTLSLTLTPTYGWPGVTVSFLGLGLGSTDTSCTLTSTPSAPTNGASLIASPSCTVSSGTATGSFIVNSLATTDGSPWTVTLTGNPVSDHLTAQFTLVPVIGVSPTNGNFGTVVTVTGFGFSSKATTCSLTSAPTGLASGTSACSIIVPGPSGSGQISGTFTVATSIPAGTYVVTAKDNLGNSASTTFTIGTPTAQLTISPNSVLPLTSGSLTVAVTGFGFNPVDTGTCAVAPIGGGITFGTCTMSGGNAAVTLTIPSSTPSGLYLVTITGSPNGDFASNYLAVGAFTTATSTTSTTTASTTLTSTSTTTTSTNLFTSQSTTTLQTTGFSTWIFTSRTATTTSAVTTASIISTIFSTSIFMTTFITTVRTTFTSTLGQIIQPAVSDGVLPTSFGLVALLLLAVPFLLRRLTD